MRRCILFVALALSSITWAAKVPSPKEFLGHDACEDYYLANYTELTGYWKALAAKSNRLTVQSIGKTEDGRDQMMCVITDPSNRPNLEKIRKGNERLAKAKDFKNDDEVRQLIKSQKAVIWIDGGLHANEVLETQHLIEMAYRLASQEDDETKRVLKDCVILLVHANPDGNEWISNWYMRRSDPKTRSVAGLPFLYQKYCGHDNNRDFYANNMAETRNINQVLYKEWFPQVVYNHHQSAPAGTIMFCPPFRNPFNYNMDAMIDIGTDLVGTHMHQRMISEGKPGTAMRNTTLYSTWWNGGLRTTTYFHNMIGILTETFGSPNPGPLPFVEKYQIPSTDVPLPVEGGKMWHLRDSLEYEISANYAILDYASRYRERVLFDFYRAGRNSVERGSKDTWSRYPSRIMKFGADALKKPELRDARYYVINSDQPDFATATKFVEKLMQCGIEVERLTTNKEKWPMGSFVIRCDQSFRPHILDMFEPQDHPNDFQYPGGPPIPPYDNAGYTLAFQMGVKFDRVLEQTSFISEKVSLGKLTGSDKLPTSGSGIFLPATQNDSITVVNRAWKAGLPVSSGQLGYEVTGSSTDLAKIVKDIPNLNAEMSRSLGGTVTAKKPRVALWDQYGGSMESGWTRYILEQFGFEFEVVYPPDLDTVDLRSKYDIIIFPSGAGVRGGRQQGTDNRLEDLTIPLQYRNRIGSMSAGTVERIEGFVKDGGHIFCIGSTATSFANLMKLPVKSALVDDKGVNLPNTKFYIPGSVLQLKLNESDLTKGMGATLDVMYDNSPSFRVSGNANAIGTFDSAKPLRSGWAWGQEALEGSAAVIDVPVGKGQAVLVGPEILFRAQNHGAFKLLFNAILRSSR